LENKLLKLKKAIQDDTQCLGFPKQEPEPGYHWERINRYKLYKACTSGVHKDHWMLYFSSDSLKSCEEVAAEINKDLYQTKIKDAGKPIWVQRLIY
tara:strand:+ start:630 stop:917 length:288 start_codon:yes stop_codon:yes gene_type:complete